MMQCSGKGVGLGPTKTDLILARLWGSHFSSLTLTVSSFVPWEVQLGDLHNLI